MSPAADHASHEVARDALTARAIPEMKLSDGSASSLTPPTQPAPVHLSAAEKAMRRFAVHGNAVSMWPLRTCFAFFISLFVCHVQLRGHILGANREANSVAYMRTLYRDLCIYRSLHGMVVQPRRLAGLLAFSSSERGAL